MGDQPSKPHVLPGPAPAVTTRDKELDPTSEQDFGLFGMVSERAGSRRIDGIVVGVVVGIAETGEPLVDYSENPRAEAIPARGVVAITSADTGREVALMFEGGRPSAPIAIGLMHRPSAPSESDQPAERDRLVLEAQREIEIRCGESSILLTRDGKIRIKGRDILTRATGGNRIKGGSVRIN